MYIQCSNYLSQIFFQANKLLSISSSILAFKALKKLTSQKWLTDRNDFLEPFECNRIGRFWKVYCLCLH